MKLKILKNLFIYFLLFTPISLGVISCYGNNKSSSKFKEESPDSTRIQCQVTPGRGNPRDSATENKPP